MKWYQGSIPNAIQEAHSKRAIFMVYVNGADEQSEEMSAQWEDETIKQALEEAGVVALKLESNSENCKHFSKIYPVVCVPSVFFVGENGVPLEVTGKVTTEELKSKIMNAKYLHEAQLRGEPLGSPVNPTGATARRVSPSTDSPIPLSTSINTTASDAAPSSPTIDTSLNESAADAFSDEEPGSSGVASPSTSTAPTLSPEERASTLTPEEKEAKIQRAQELRERVKREKLQKEREKEREDEKKRREMGQQVTKLKQWQAEKEAEALRDELKKNKNEERLARQRVKEQIAKDRAERAAKSQKDKADREDMKAATAAAAAAAKKEEAAPKPVNLDNSRLQFRLPDGSAIMQQFSSSQTLGEARDFLAQRIAGQYKNFTLCCNYPKRDFSSADMSRSLLDLSLAPSAALVVLPGSQSIRSSGGGPVSSSDTSFIWTILAPLVFLWNFLSNLLFGRPQQNQPQAGAENSSQVNDAVQRTREARSNRPTSSYGVRRREGNMHTLRRDDDDRTETYNGNSTQQL